VCECVMTRCY